MLVRYHDALARADAETEDAPPELIDIANEQWEARVLTLLGEHDAQTLDNIAAALDRIDRGTYGECVACGEAISAARLRVLPEAAYCAGCATSAEERTPRFTREAS